MKVSIGLILSLFMTVLVISSAGCVISFEDGKFTLEMGGGDDDEPTITPPEIPIDPIIPPSLPDEPDEPKVIAPHYLEDYSVTPTNDYYGMFRDGNKIYIRYVIAEIDDATLSELSTIHNSGGIQSLELTSTDSWSSRTEETMDELIHDAVTQSVSASVGMSVSVPLSIVEVGVDTSVSAAYEHVNEKTTEKSINKIVSSASEEIKSYDIDFTQYPIDSKLYRLVMKGNCLLVQTLVYDLDKQEFDTSQHIVDTVVVGTPYMIIESCDREERFEIPESYFERVNFKSSVNLADILSGDGTDENPHLISSEEECLLILIDPVWSSYKLTADIDMSSYSWFNPYEHTKRLNTGGHDLYVLGSEYNPHEIASESDFLKIYDDLSAHYELTADIVLTSLLHSEDSVFTGSLDGNGHSISSKSEEAISIGPEKYSSKQYFGLFSENKGTIKDLVFERFVVRGGKQDSGEWIYVGSIAGQNSGTISNVKIIDGTVSIMRAGAAVGMVAGINNAGATIENCLVDGGYIYSRGNGGGVVGYNYGKIVSAIVIGNGIDGGSVDDLRFLHHRNKCEGSGDNTGEGRSWGGIVGITYPGSEMWDVSIRDAYMDINIEGVTGTCYFGWIVGKNRGYIADPTSVENVKYRYDTNILGEVIKGTHQKFKGDKKAYGVNDGGDIPASW